MAITTLEEYLREFSVEIGDRILTSFPALNAPGDPVSPILGKLLRKPFAAQEVAIARAVARLRQANSVACIAEMGTCHLNQNMARSATLMIYFHCGQIMV